MMRLYVKHFVENGAIVHTVTSDAPIPSEIVITAETKKNQLNPSYTVVEEEFDVSEFVRAGDMRKLRKFNKGTNKVEADNTAPAKLKAKLLKKTK